MSQAGLFQALHFNLNSGFSNTLKFFVENKFSSDGNCHWHGRIKPPHELTRRREKPVAGPVSIQFRLFKPPTSDYASVSVLSFTGSFVGSSGILYGIDCPKIRRHVGRQH
jgi:hypothetical protein